MSKQVFAAVAVVVALVIARDAIAQGRGIPEAATSELETSSAQKLQDLGPSGGPPRMGQVFDGWFRQLAKAYEENDLDKIGQLIRDMEQIRARRQERWGEAREGARPRQGQARPGSASVSSSETPHLQEVGAEQRILAVLDDMYRDQRRGMMNVPPEDGRLLRLLTETMNAKHVVEIGTSNGYSGIWFCLALRTTGGKLTTHEIDAYRASLARENFKRASVEEIVTLVEGDAHDGVTKLKEPIDILFLDADKEGYIDYLEKLLPMVRPGGLIVAHNTSSYAQGIEDYLKAVTTDPALETIFLHKDMAGLGVTLKKR